jgi:hypothetical protein
MRGPIRLLADQCLRNSEATKADCPWRYSNASRSGLCDLPMTLSSSATRVFAGCLAARPSHFVGSLCVVAAPIASVFSDTLARLSRGLGCDHDQLFALEFSFSLSDLVIGPFAALLPPPHCCAFRASPPWCCGAFPFVLGLALSPLLRARLSVAAMAISLLTKQNRQDGVSVPGTRRWKSVLYLQ